MADTPCADAFAAAAPGPPSGDPAALEPALRALYARVAAAAPEFRLTPEDVSSAVARSDALRPLVARGDAAAVEPEALAEVALVAAVRRGDRAALAAFEARYVAPLGLALARLRLDAATLDEVRQQVRTKLLLPDARGAAPIEAYAGAGRLVGLVRVTATRAALDLLRRGRRASAGDDADLLDLPGVAADPGLAALKETYRAEFRAAFGAAVCGLAQRERNLLRLHLLGGVTLEQLAAMYAVHRATVVRWLADARRGVLEGTRRELRTRLRVRPEELESLMRLCESGLDVSVERLLRSERDEPEGGNPQG